MIGPFMMRPIPTSTMAPELATELHQPSGGSPVAAVSLGSNWGGTTDLEAVEDRVVHLLDDAATGIEQIYEVDASDPDGDILG